MCTGVHGLLEIFHILLPARLSSPVSSVLPAPARPTFRAGIENGPGGAQPADGLNNRPKGKREPGKEKKKKARVVPPLGRASFRESVIHRDIAESLLTEVSMIPAGERFNSCPNDYVRVVDPAPTRADTRASRGRPAIDVFSIPRQSDIIRV